MKEKLEQLINMVLEGQFGTKNRAELLERLWGILEELNEIRNN